MKFDLFTRNELAFKVPEAENRSHIGVIRRWILPCFGLLLKNHIGSQSVKS